MRKGGKKWGIKRWWKNRRQIKRFSRWQELEEMKKKKLKKHKKDIWSKGPFIFYKIGGAGEIWGWVTKKKTVLKGGGPS